MVVLLSLSTQLAAVLAASNPLSSLEITPPAGSATGVNPYVPVATSCPSDNHTFVREADSLSDGEKKYLSKRDKYTQEALIDWLGNSNMSDFDASKFLSNQTIRIGLAYSGGGYRAMLCGAGQLAAIDNSTDGATGDGQLGGLYQASTYLAGLSGGNWLTGSIAGNNFTSVQELQNSDLWDISHNLVNPGGINVFKTFGYWDDIIDAVKAKQRAGWNCSLTDLWGRGLSYQMFNGTEGGIEKRFSDIRDDPKFLAGEVPFPVSVADRRNIGDQIIDLNSTVFEFNPFEIGSWDPNTYQFADLRYVGTMLKDSSPVDEESCVVGYDQMGFMIGTSATLFNQFILQINGTGISGKVYDLAHSILSDLSEDNNDISIFRPNPFYDIGDYVDSDRETLTLVDGGEDNMNVPIYPLYQPQRKVDVVFAMDNSADTNSSWPDGASLVATYNRQFGSLGNGTHFPYVPDTDTFISNGLVGQPTFFGCNITNLTSLYVNDTKKSLGNSSDDGVNVPPVIVYIANSLHSYNGNTSTFKLSYDTDERDQVITNGFNVMSQNNGTLDSEWRACVGCAIVLREQQRRGVTPTEQCQKCFTKYCWDGSTTSSKPNNTLAVGAPIRRDGKSNLVGAAASSASSASASSSKKKNDAPSGQTVGNSAVVAAILGAISYFI